MIVRREAGGWTLIRQMDHAAHCGEIARAWRNGPFGHDAVSPALEHAAATHDLGWNEVDGTPETTDDGAPRNFTQFDEERHAGFYARAVRTIARDDPHAAYLVSLHASGLKSGRYGWRGFRRFDFSGVGAPGHELLRGERDLRARLVGELEPTAVEFERAWRDYMLLQAFDFMSLLTCFGLESDACGPVPTLRDQFTDISVSRLGPWEVKLDPFPFAGDALELEVTCTRLQAERFASDSEVREKYAAAHPERQRTVYRR